MNKIVHKEILASGIKKIEVESPLIAKKVRAGQFVILIVDEKGERIPLTLVDCNRKKQTISLIFQEVGYSTIKLGKLEVGDSLYAMLGPLGKPAYVKNFGTVICMGGGVGIAEVYPISRVFKEAKNKIIGIIGSRSKNLLILENELSSICDELYIATDDGSYGQKGFVTDVLRDILESHANQVDNSIGLVYAIGPVPMMKAVSELTRPYNIKTLVSLNPILVDATGMCGSCRCTVSGKTVFGCVDGPEFNGHQIDFDELEKRLDLFKEQEKCVSK